MLIRCLSTQLSHRYKALAMLQTYLTSLSASLTNASS